MKKYRKLMAGIACMAFVMIAGALPARAATVTKVVNYTKGTHTFRRDITGDGKSDNITLKTNMDKYNDAISSIQVSVNGKNALTINQNAGSYYVVTVNYIKMSNSKEFLQIMGFGDNDWLAVNRIYQYNKKTQKLKNVLELTTELNAAGSVIKATSENIQIQYSLQPVETGRVNWNYTYTFKNGKFRLKSSTAAVKSSLTTYDNGDGYFKYFKNSKFKAKKTLTFYTSASQREKAFTAKKNSVLQLKKIKISGNNVYLQFKLGSKTGWKKVCNNYSDIYGYSYDKVTGGKITGGWFYGVSNRLAG